MSVNKNNMGVRQSYMTSYSHFFTFGIKGDKMKIDNEYSTMFVDEQQYLSKCGVKYTFVKTENGITIWKYKKTPRLFEKLKNFYINNEYYNLEG